MVSAMSHIWKRLPVKELPAATINKLLSSMEHPWTIARILDNRFISSSPDHLALLHRFMAFPESFEVLYRQTRFRDSHDQLGLLESALIEHHVAICKLLVTERFFFMSNQVDPNFFAAFWSREPFLWTYEELKELRSYTKLNFFKVLPEHAHYCATSQARDLYVASMQDEVTSQGNPHLWNDILVALTSWHPRYFLGDAEMAAFADKILSRTPGVEYEQIIDQLNRFYRNHAKTLDVILRHQARHAAKPLRAY
jgi:hypothetical protein